MQLKIIFFFVVLAAVGAKEKKCGEEKALKCIWKLTSFVMQESSDEEICAALSEATDCMNGAAEECTGEKRNPEIYKQRQELRSLISQKCPGREQEIPVDIEQCLSGLQEKLMECVRDSVAEILENIMLFPGEAEVDEYEIRCSMYQFVTKCVEQKVEDSCGKEASQLALEVMLDAPKEIQKSCSYVDIKGALKKLADDIVKRRK